MNRILNNYKAEKLSEKMKHELSSRNGDVFNLLQESLDVDLESDIRPIK
jgi:hypothetical protein